MVYNFVALLVARFVVLAGLLQSLRLMAAADSLSSLPLSIYLSIFLALAPASCTDFRRRCFFFCSLSLVASYQRVFFFEVFVLWPRVGGLHVYSGVVYFIGAQERVRTTCCCLSKAVGEGPATNL